MNTEHFQYCSFFCQIQKNLSKLIVVSPKFNLYFSYTYFKQGIRLYMFRKLKLLFFSVWSRNSCALHNRSIHNINGTSDQNFQTICEVTAVRLNRWMQTQRDRNKKPSTRERHVIHLFHIHDLAEYQCSKLENYSRYRMLACAISNLFAFILLLACTHFVSFICSLACVCVNN